MISLFLSAFLVCATLIRRAVSSALTIKSFLFIHSSVCMQPFPCNCTEFVFVKVSKTEFRDNTNPQLDRAATSYLLEILSSFLEYYVLLLYTSCLVFHSPLFWTFCISGFSYFVNELFPCHGTKYLKISTSLSSC